MENKKFTLEKNGYRAEVSVNAYGYKITTFDPKGKVVEVYEAGNNRYESAPSASVPPDSPAALSIKLLEEFARYTAEEMLDEAIEGLV